MCEDSEKWYRGGMKKYGLFGKLQAQAGKGGELGEILLRAASLMEHVEGCILYIVNEGADNPDAIWVMEVWESKEAHDDSFNIPGIRELIMQAMPILAETTEDGITLEVLGGKGLSIRSEAVPTITTNEES